MWKVETNLSHPFTTHVGLSSIFVYCNPTVGITFHYNLSYPIASPINKMLGLCIKELWLVAEKSSLYSHDITIWEGIIPILSHTIPISMGIPGS